jgi:hypothetical protein
MVSVEKIGWSSDVVANNKKYYLCRKSNPGRQSAASVFTELT